MQIYAVHRRARPHLAAALFSAGALCVPLSAPAQEHVVAPVSSGVVEEQLPANTEVLLEFTAELNSATAKENQRFTMTVADEVVLDGAVAIPKGAPAIGHVTHVSAKGAFGKPATIAITLDSIEVRGRAYGLSGNLVYQPDSNRRATIGAVAVGGLLGGLAVSGHDAVLPPGRQLAVVTRQDIPVDVPRRAAQDDEISNMFNVDPDKLTIRDKPQ